MLELHQETVQLLVRWSGGDELAAADLHRRYVHRLMALTNGRLSPHLGMRFDSDDVVQSAFRTFFRRFREGELVPRPGADLWALLAEITLRKLSKQVRKHRAGKRSVEREAGSDDLEKLPRIEAPDELAAIDELKKTLLGQLDETDCGILDLQLQGCTLQEIADRVGLSKRTVQRAIDRIRERASSLLAKE
jgi:RNA polymerase sigma factor (sigma-70 family)